jgi:hypothetical protein
MYDTTLDRQVSKPAPPMGFTGPGGVGKGLEGLLAIEKGRGEEMGPVIATIGESPNLPAELYKAGAASTLLTRARNASVRRIRHRLRSARVSSTVAFPIQP